VDIKHLTKEEALRMYFEEYWLPHCSELEYPFNVVVFDTVVNMGPKGLDRIVQEWNRGDDLSLNGFLNCRIARYLSLIQKNSSLGKFKKGWLNRVNDLKKFINLLENT
jgi:lysozyme family protein